MPISSMISDCDSRLDHSAYLPSLSNRRLDKLMFRQQTCNASKGICHLPHICYAAIFTLTIPRKSSGITIMGIFHESVKKDAWVTFTVPCAFTIASVGAHYFDIKLLVMPTA